MKTTSKYILLTAALFAWSCGEGVVNISSDLYTPKIAVEGYIYPGKAVSNIEITRNVPLNTEVDVETIILSDATAFIEDESGKNYPLRFNPFELSFEYPGNDLLIEHGKSYTLDVSATVEGQALHTRSTTTVPQPGLGIDPTASMLENMTYRERDADGNLKNFKVVVDRSPGTDFYALSLSALGADTASFIYENTFEEFDPEDVLDDFPDFAHRYMWNQDTPLTAGKTGIDILWFDVWFYGRYRAIVFAADRNFRDFFRTSDEVQELDGNFHEPVMYFEGDGIGVFGSAVTDTTYFEVVRTK